MGGGLLHHHRGFLVGFQVMLFCAGLVTGSASALTSYLCSGAHGMVVYVKTIFPYLNKDRLRPFEYKLDTICNIQPHVTLIRLQRIYNFLLFHAIILPFWMFMGFILHICIIFGTNLLTGGPTQNCCFLPISEFRRKRISNGVQTE